MPTYSNEKTTTYLDEASIGEKLFVAGLRRSPTAPDWDRWLEEIGFIPGERVELMARGFPAGDPLVVRIGLSTFALRSAEAACVEVSAKVTTA